MDRPRTVANWSLSPKSDPVEAKTVRSAADPGLASEAARWDEASSEVRKTALWLAGAMGSAGAVVFGAGPFIDDADPANWDLIRWVLVAVCAAVGVLGVVAIIGRLVTAMVPVEHTLDTLPDGLLKRIEAAPSLYLPGDACSIADFHDRLKGYARGAEVYTQQARKAQKTQDRDRLKGFAQVQAANRDLYRRSRTELLDQAKYHSESSRLRGWKTTAWFAGASVAAVLGASGFTFLTHEPDDPEPATPPQLASLAPAAELGGEELWPRLGLEPCLDDDGFLPVLFLRSDGADPVRYTVQTLGQPADCPRYELTVESHVVTLLIPSPAKITVTSNPSVDGDQ